MSAEKAITVILRLKDELINRRIEKALIFNIINRMPDAEAKSQLLRELINEGITEENLQQEAKKKQTGR